MDNIRVVCEANPDVWVEYRPALTRRDITAYAEAIAANDSASLTAALTAVIADMDVCGCKTIDQFNTAENLPIYAETFFALSFGEAIAIARQLGKPKRLA